MYEDIEKTNNKIKGDENLISSIIMDTVVIEGNEEDIFDKLWFRAK